MSATKITRFLGDGEYAFNLAPQIVQLEKQLGAGIGELSQNIAAARFRHRDLIEIIRFSLIGAGTSPEEAKRLIDVFVDGAPLKPAHALATEILAATWDGEAEPETEAKADEPA